MPPLTSSQIDQLIAQGCRAVDWATVTIDAAADLTRIRAVQFVGAVTVGANRADALVDGVSLPCGLYDATIADCAIGANVRIARIGSVVARYNIADDVVIQDVAALVCEAGATFGAGTDVGVVNESGGRAVRLLPSLSSQSAYLQAFRSHSGALTAAVRALVDAEVTAARKDRGEVGAHARVLHCGPIHNVHIGPHSLVHGAARLEDGTILSCAEHPTLVADAVQAQHFIIAEGASVAGGALLDKVFVGQACRVGRQFSAENSVFFANCELFHGEAVAAFCGPYTVTHHKGTLLIAAGFSFYNAGAGTNQSNHMYKLGPIHQGVFERGTKTGSLSYVMHETHVGAFSVIIGRHYSNISTPDLPFSYIHESEGRTEIVPGLNLFSVGTVRDGEKWPTRDRRRAPVRRDLVSFAVFSPFTVEKMRAGRAVLRHLIETTPEEKSTVHYGGAIIRRQLFSKCDKYYAVAITRHLGERVFDRIETVSAASAWRDVQQALQPAAALREPLAWTDMGGLLMPVERLRALEAAIVDGSLASLAAVHTRLAAIAAAYESDEWDYVCTAFALEHGYAPHEMSRDQAVQLLADYDAAASGIHGKLADDARKEFGAVAHISYGLDMSEDERIAEFTAVRGSADNHPVVQQLVREQHAMAERSRTLAALLGRLT